MFARGLSLSGRRGAQSLLGAVLILTATPGSTTTLVAGAAGAARVGDGVAGPAGGAGPIPAGGLSRAVAPANAVPAVPAAAGPHRAAAPSGLLSDRLEQLVLLGVGVGLIAGVSMLRARQRRRIGWGVLPERGWPDDRLWQ